MLIKHEKLGHLKVEVNGNIISVKVKGEIIEGYLKRLQDGEYVIKYYEKNKGISGMKINKYEYKMIELESDKQKEDKAAAEYAIRIESNASYSHSFDFGTRKKYNSAAVQNVRESLISNKKIEKLQGFGDYNDTEIYGIKLKEVEEMLKHQEWILEIERDLRKKEEAEKMELLAKKAETSGEDILIEKHCAECNDPVEDCSLDVVYEWITPEGKFKTTREHTW